MVDSSDLPTEGVYHPEVDIENLEEYVLGGYHPTLIGDTFCDNRYAVVHKLGFGGYSTIWLARDQNSRRYVSLKILTARASENSYEGEVLDYLMKSDYTHPGKRFIPPLLDQFSFEGPNGHHRCLVGEPAGGSIAQSKENSGTLMFSAEAARSTAAQLVLGVSYLHDNGICHGDLHLRNFLLRTPEFDCLSTAELYQRFGQPCEVPIRRVDGRIGEPHAPPHAIYPLGLSMPADEVKNPEVIISDYGTSFIMADTPTPTLYTPALYCPPEVFFKDRIQPIAADVWTLGVNLYEVLGERPLFETFSWDPDDIVAEMINTLGRPPVRWWKSWNKRSEFFKEDGLIITPVFRPLRQRLWEMGRGDTEQTCEWDVAGGELRALEDLFRAMLAFDPAERPTAAQVLGSEYMLKWALPAWERQLSIGY